MSRQTLEDVTCPQCQTKTSILVHHSINVTVDPELREHVLNNEFNRFTCPSCGLQAPVSVSVLYHDMQQDFWMWFSPTEEFYPVAADEMLRLSPVPMLESLMRRKTRHVRTRNELIEKILLFGAGLDDYAFEFVKIRALRQHPELAQYEIYFDGIEGDRLVCAAFKDGERGRVTFSRRDYESSEYHLRELKPEQERRARWPRVDRERVEKLVGGLLDSLRRT